MTGCGGYQGLVVGAANRQRLLLRSRLLEAGCVEVVHASTPMQALEALTARAVSSPPTRWLVLITTDPCATESATLITRALTLHPPALVLGIGTPSDARGLFRLARAGVHDIFFEPPSVVELSEAVDAATSQPVTLRRWLQPLVGALTWKEIQAQVREAVLAEALERSQGSRRAAARTLGLSRTAVQRMLRTPLNE